MTMRCRYSRRLYLLKSQFHNPDYIDDTDLAFLENLITFHINYVGKCSKPVQMNSSLLPEKYRQLFDRIAPNYSLITECTLKTELYKKFDLEYKGEERHARSVKEQIIEYLQKKKGNIFTHRRVEFFLKLALTIKLNEFRKMCKEMQFSIKSPRRSNFGVRKKHLNNNTSYSSKVNDNVPLLDRIDTQTIPIEERETLLLPYLAMVHPPCVIDYDRVTRIIYDNHSSFEDDTMKNKTINSSSETDIVDLTEKIKPETNGHKHSSPNHNNRLNLAPKHTSELLETPKIPPKCMPALIDIFGQSTKTSQVSSSRRSARHNNRPITSERESESVQPRHQSATHTHKATQSSSASSVELTKTRTPIMDGIISAIDVNVDPPKDCSGQLNNNTTTKRTKLSSCVVPVTTVIDDIIEISDDDSVELQPNIVPDVQDIDQMIDFLIHRCAIEPNTHPTLLNDNQMKIELNGFLLFVNISIRFSLKVALVTGDKKIFDCIFISSIIIGLHCSVYMNTIGITINKLSSDDFHIAIARLTSVQVTVVDTDEHNGLYSLVINPDISKLVHLSTFYVAKYHRTGALSTASEVSDPNVAPH